MQHIIVKALGIMFDSATHPINVGTCAHNIFCFGGQVINHKYPKHKEEVEGLEKSNVQRNAIYIYYNKVLHRKNISGSPSFYLITLYTESYNFKLHIRFPYCFLSKTRLVF